MNDIWDEQLISDSLCAFAFLIWVELSSQHDSGEGGNHFWAITVAPCHRAKEVS